MPASSRASRTPRSPMTKAVFPRHPSRLSMDAVATPEVRTSSGRAAMPSRSSLPATSPGVRLELFVRNRILAPRRRTSGSASTAPATGRSPRYTTPSRSMNRASYRSTSEPITEVPRAPGRSSLDASERLPIFRRPRPHGDGELQMRDGPRALPGPGAGQGQPEVRVVVHRVDLDGLGELAAGPRGPAGQVQGPPEGLPDRSLLRLQELRLPEEHGRLMRMAGSQELPGAFDEVVHAARSDVTGTLHGGLPSPIKDICLR